MALDLLMVIVAIIGLSLPGCRSAAASDASLEAEEPAMNRRVQREGEAAETVPRLIGRWFEDYNTNHPLSGLKMRSPREFIAA